MNDQFNNTYSFRRFVPVAVLIRNTFRSTSIPIINPTSTYSPTTTLPAERYQLPEISGYNFRDIWILQVFSLPPPFRWNVLPRSSSRKLRLGRPWSIYIDSGAAASAETSVSNYKPKCVTSGFHPEVAAYSVLLGQYAASSGHFLPKFRLSRNVDKKLPLHAA